MGQHVGFLQQVSGEADDLGRRVVIDALAGVLVADRDAVIFRCQGGQGEQAQGREHRLVLGHPQEVFHAPNGGGEFRLDEVNGSAVGSIRIHDIYPLKRILWRGAIVLLGRAESRSGRNLFVGAAPRPPIHPCK